MRFRTTSEGILRLFFSEPPSSGHSPAIFLDRDGLINERIFGGYVTQWSEFRFINGIERTLAALSSLALPMIVISNQAGVGKGLVAVDRLQEITDRFVSELRAQGARIDAVYYCPHVPEAGCSCRKPGIGLLLQAAQDWRIDLKRSVLIGDSLSDVQAALASGCRALLVAPSIEPTASPLVSEENCLTIHDTSEIVPGVNQLLQKVP